MLLIEQTVVTLQELEFSEGVGVGFGGGNRGICGNSIIGKVNSRFRTEMEVNVKVNFGVYRVQKKDLARRIECRKPTCCKI